jgi:3-dehydroquinate synthase
MDTAATVKVLNFKDLGALGSAKKKESKSRIIIGEGVVTKDGLLEGLVLELFQRQLTSCVVITDSNVARLYSQEIVQHFSQIHKTSLIKLPPGEESKSIDSSVKILAQLAKLGFDKEGLLVLLGGGVIGDLGGFVASIYKRGVKYIQLPTTLLAQIDSSIGGKTGVDATWGKNQIGTIYQPIGVIIDPSFLKTLPEREFLNGIGEMVKYGVTSNARIFEELEGNSNFESLSELTHMIEPCVKIKAKIVSRDPNDSGLRSILNYGHTIGHSIEASSNYKASHGVSVLFGMLGEGWIAHELGLFQKDDFQRQELLIKRLLRKRNNNTQFRAILSLRHEMLAKFALSDKKNAAGKLRMSLPDRIGRMHINEDGTFKIPVSLDLFKSSFRYMKSIFSET